MMILVVEDFPPLREVVADLLHSYGHQTVCASGVGEVMLEPIPAPDCLVVDYVLPDGTALDVIRRVRARSHTEIPAVILTAFNPDALGRLPDGTLLLGKEHIGRLPETLRRLRQLAPA